MTTRIDQRVDGDEDEAFDDADEPIHRISTSQSIEHTVAMLLGLPLRDVRDVALAYTHEVMRVIAEQGWLRIPGFGTFRLKAYRGKAPAREELRAKRPRGKRKLVTGIVKHEVRFTKSRRFRQMIHDYRGEPMEIVRQEQDAVTTR